MSRLLAVAALAAVIVVGAASAARTPASAIAGPTVTGGAASLAGFRGKPVFVNVWSSW